MRGWTTLFTSCIGIYKSNNFMFAGVVSPLLSSLSLPLSSNYLIILQVNNSGADLYANNMRYDPGHYNRSKYHLAQFPFGNNLPVFVRRERRGKRGARSEVEGTLEGREGRDGGEQKREIRRDGERREGKEK
jgi:hypothetical protein